MARGKRGSVYVLEMGEQIRLVDMARNPGSGPGQALRVRPAHLPEPASLARKVGGLGRLAALGEAVAVIEGLCEIVPAFQPVEMNGSPVEAGE